MELTLFFIVGTIALISAAMMLTTENAIYSALFLILNFACIAFFFLMLNAAFLAMVQITVYAGAIMVLFLFVIMLLGAERALPSAEPGLRWVTPVVLVLALAFAITAGAAILRGELALTDAPPTEPTLRVVHAIDGVPEADVYVNDRRIARGLDFADSTGFEASPAGPTVITLYPAGAEPAEVDPLLRHELVLIEGQAVSLAALGRTHTPGLAPSFVPIVHDVAFIEDARAVRVAVVNSVPEYGTVDVLDVSDEDNRRVLVEAIGYGEYGAVEIPAGDYDIGVYPQANHRTQLTAIDDHTLRANTSVLWVLAEERQPDNSFRNVVITLEAFSSPVFGGPTHVGRVLFSDYVLPFEMVSLLLLVAMIGAIVLTHEKLVAPGPRAVRRLANPPPGLEQPVQSEPGK